MKLEELEIVIKANIEQAMSKLREVSNAVREVAQKGVMSVQQTAPAIQQTVNKVNGIKKALVETTAQQEMLNRKMDYYRGLIDEAMADGQRFDSHEVLGYRVELEKLTKQYNALGTQSKITGSSVSTSMKKGVSSLKRFGLALFSIRGIYSAISRVVSQFKATDESLRASMDLTINAMGQALAPAIRAVTDVLQYLVIGFALLIKMFTGFDALAKVTTKKINDAASATKDLNKELLGLDEITNLSGQQTGVGGLDLTADFKALEEFNKKIADVQKLFEDWNIQGLVDNLKTLGKWIWDNKEAVILFGGTFLLWFSGAKLASMIGGIGSLRTALGLLVGALAVASIVDSILKIKDALDDSNRAAEALIKHMETLGILQQEVIDDIIERNRLGEMTPEQIKASVDRMKDLKKQAEDELKILKDQKLNLWAQYGIIALFTPQWKQVEDEINFITTKELPNLDKGINELLKDKSFKITTTLDTAQMPNQLKQALKTALSGVSSVFSALGIKIPKFATGTVAKQPTMGVFGEYSGARTNPEIVSPKNDMIDAVSQALQMHSGSSEDSDKSYVFNVNGKELARAIYDDMQYEGNRLGQQSTSVRRVG